MDFRHLKITVLALAAALLLAACAKQSQAPSPAAADEVAAFAASGSAGASAALFDARLGQGTATLGARYISALGRPCRRVNFRDQGGRLHQLAACAEADGAWATVAPIFENPPAR